MATASPVREDIGGVSQPRPPVPAAQAPVALPPGPVVFRDLASI